MHALVEQLRRSATAQVALGNAAGAGLGLLLLLVLSRSLGVTGYGQIAPVLTMIDLGQLLIDTLLAAGVVTVASRRMTLQDADDALYTGLLLRLAGGLIYAAILVLAAEWLSRKMLPDLPLAVWMMRSAGIAGGFLAVQSALIGISQITNRFHSVAISSSYKNLCRLGAALLCLGLGVRDPALLGIALAVSGLVALAATMVTCRGRFGSGRFSPQIAHEMLAINKWMVLASVSIVASRVDIMLLSAFSTPDQVAYYAASLQLCVAIGILSQAIVTTQLPHVSRLEERDEMRRYAVTWVKRAPWSLLAVAVFPFVSPWLLSGLMGGDFRPGHRVFDLLFASSMLTLVMNPLLLTLFPLGSARLFGLIALLQVLGKWAIAWVVILPYGATGLAGADVLTKLTAAGAILWFVFHALGKGSAPADPAQARDS
ncbi:oligosaccharide flippase family protein [Paracoccus ravus]|uniref:oligosaccharide flippase family protein n=1 Tax=Paracoccus ravus TaxID=2447760 RepID=UPI00142F9553|nr:oligosaccharide flippase family protein [Paracoccus ravus]